MVKPWGDVGMMASAGRRELVVELLLSLPQWWVVPLAPHVTACHGHAGAAHCARELLASQGLGACMGGPAEPDSPSGGMRSRAGRGSCGLMGPCCPSCCASGADVLRQPTPVVTAALVPSIWDRCCPQLTGRQLEDRGQQESLVRSHFPPLQNMLRRQEELENGTAWSISSESSDDSSSPQLSGSARHATHKPIVQPEVQASAPAIEISFSHQPEEAGAGPGAGNVGTPPTVSQPEEPGSHKKEAVANGHVPYSRTLSHISEASVDAPMEAKSAESPWEPAPSLEDMGAGEQDVDALPSASVAAAVAGQDRAAEAKPRAAVAWAVTGEEEAGGAEPVQSRALARGVCGTGVPAAPAQAMAEERPVPTPPLPAGVPEVPRAKVVDSGLEEAISLLGSALDDYRGQFPELQPLERELKHLEEMLLVRGSQQCPGARGMGLFLMAVPRDNGDGAIPAGSAQERGWQGHPLCPGTMGMGLSWLIVPGDDRKGLSLMAVPRGGAGRVISSGSAWA